MAKASPHAPAPCPRGDELPHKCAWCGDVRELGGIWRALSSRDPHDGVFSHGICPRCLERAAVWL